jgi:hypothetical protein
MVKITLLDEDVCYHFPFSCRVHRQGHRQGPVDHAYGAQSLQNRCHPRAGDPGHVGRHGARARDPDCPTGYPGRQN